MSFHDLWDRNPRVTAEAIACAITKASKRIEWISKDDPYFKKKVEKIQQDLARDLGPSVALGKKHLRSERGACG